jgi:hypothetical protein
MGNLLRVTEFNRRAFRTYVDRTPFNLENQHILVGLLQQLSIDPDWDLDYVVKYTRFRANSLCSTFKITSINRIGDPITNGFYRDNTREHWVLLDNTKEYSEELGFSMELLRPVVPLFSTVLERGYKHNEHRSRLINDKIDDVAIIGLDLVELAIGWWLYMKEERDADNGIHAYVSKHPMVSAQLIHNQLAVVNILYEFFVKEQDLNTLISTSTVTFTTLSEEKLFKEYILFLIDSFTSTGRRLVDLGHMIAQIPSLYDTMYFSYVSSGQNAVFSQTVWAMEPQVLKLCAIYLSIANRMKYRASDINVAINRCIPAMMGRYRNVPGKHFREILMELALEVKSLNTINSK